MPELEFHWHGLSCVEVQVDCPQSPILFRQLGRVAEEIRESKKVDGAVSAYQSIAVYWSSFVEDREGEVGWLREALTDGLANQPDHNVSTVHEIAAKYNGPDLGFVASHAGLSESDVVEIHSETEYVVAAIGFLPNFAYLWGLDDRLVTPRKTSPRVRVPAGAIGIGGKQTGIYPAESPGGWQLIGSAMTNNLTERLSQFSIGDVVRFRGAS